MLTTLQLFFIFVLLSACVVGRAQNYDPNPNPNPNAAPRLIPTGLCTDAKLDEEWKKFDACDCLQVNAASPQSHLKSRSSSSSGNNGLFSPQQVALLFTQWSCLVSKHPFLSQCYHQVDATYFLAMPVGDQSAAKSTSITSLLNFPLSSSGDGTCTRTCTYAMRLPDCHQLAKNQQPMIEISHPLLPKIRLNSGVVVKNGRAVLSVLDALDADQQIMDELDKTNSFSDECIHKTLYACDSSLFPTYVVDSVGIIGAGQVNEKVVSEYNQQLIEKYAKGKLLLITHRMMIDPQASNLNGVLRHFYNPLTKSYPFQLVLLITFSNVDLLPKLQHDKIPDVTSFKKLVEKFCHPVLQSISAPLDTPCVFVSGSSVDTRQFLEFVKQSGFDSAMKELKGSSTKNANDLEDALNMLKNSPNFILDAADEAHFRKYHLEFSPVQDIFAKAQNVIFKQQGNQIGNVFSEIDRNLFTLGGELHSQFKELGQPIDGKIVANFLSIFNRISGWTARGGRDVNFTAVVDVLDKKGATKLTDEEPRFTEWLHSHQSTVLQDLKMVAQYRHLCRNLDACPDSEYFPTIISLRLGEVVPPDAEQKIQEEVLQLAGFYLKKTDAGAWARIKNLEILVMGAYFFTRLEPITSKSIQFHAKEHTIVPSVEEWLFSVLNEALKTYAERLCTFVAHMVAAVFYNNAELALQYVYEFHPRFRPFIDIYRHVIMEVIHQQYYIVPFANIQSKARIQFVHLFKGANHILPVLQELFPSMLAIGKDVYKKYVEDYPASPDHLYDEFASIATKDRSILCNGKGNGNVNGNPPQATSTSTFSWTFGLLGGGGGGTTTTETTVSQSDNNNEKKIGWDDLQTLLYERFVRDRPADEKDAETYQHVQTALGAVKLSAMRIGAPLLSQSEMFLVFIASLSAGVSIDNNLPMSNLVTLRPREVQYLNLMANRYMLARLNMFFTGLHMDLSSTTTSETLGSRHEADLLKLFLRRVANAVKQKEAGIMFFQTNGMTGKNWMEEFGEIVAAAKDSTSNSRSSNDDLPAIVNASAEFHAADNLLNLLNNSTDHNLHTKLLVDIERGNFNAILRAFEDVESSNIQAQKRAILQKSIEKITKNIKLIRALQAQIKQATSS